MKWISEKQLQLNLRKNKLKFSVTVTLKKDVLDPQGKVVSQTLKNMGMTNLIQVRQGKFFEIDLDEKNPSKAQDQVKEMCEKLLSNQIIEDFKIKQKEWNHLL